MEDSSVPKNDSLPFPFFLKVTLWADTANESTAPLVCLEKLVKYVYSPTLRELDEKINATRLMLVRYCLYKARRELI